MKNNWKWGRTCICCGIALWLAPLSYAQEKDSLDLSKTQHLPPVVLTGQYNPQSVDKSIYEVEVIPRREIELMAGNTLADVLNQNLNLNIIPNPGEGKAGIQQFGFGADYVKILVDGVPIIGDEGFGNAIDISEVNLDDIQQIEIVEGAMGVQYGADAVTGVINIITKKKSFYDWEITPYLQEESVGSKYNWSDQGRHIQSLKVGHNFAENWYAEASFTRNDFLGFLGNKKGKSYYNPDSENDDHRGYEWLPKLQYTTKGLINFSPSSKFSAFYKFEYFDERIDKYANRVHLNPNSATQTVNPTANDITYRTHRFYHHLNAFGTLFNRVHFEWANSYQQQKLNQEQFTYRLKSGEKSNINRFDYNTRKGFFSRGTLSNFFDSDQINFEAGYEYNHDEGLASGLDEQNSAEDSQKHTINTWSGFVSSEINLGTQWSLRPGFRFSSSSAFKDQYAFSFSGKFLFGEGYQLRAVLGTAPKTPTFEQLYYYMVDANHDIRGNENLKVEKGRSAFLHLKKDYHNSDYSLLFTPKISAWYLDVKDKIDLIIAQTNPLQYRYSNINSFRNWGVALRNKIRYNRLSLSLGFAFSGTSKKYNADDDFGDDFLYSPQFNARLIYPVPDWNTTFSVFYKYNGPQYEFIQSEDGLQAENEVIKGKQEGYSWLNASVRKTFFHDNLELTLGARNILNVTEIRNDGFGESIHSGPSGEMLLGYGRSYFLKLLYHLNF